MPQLIDIEGFGTVEFPDGASPEQIQKALDTHVTPRVRATFTERADRIERGRQAEGYEPPSALRSAAESIGGAVAQLPSRLGRDLPLDLASGVVAVPEAIVGLADIPTGGRAGRLAEDLGVDFKATRSYFDSLQSAERQAERQRIQEAEGWQDKALAIAQSPGTVLGAVASSLPLMGAGGVAARGITAAAPKLGALGAALSKVPAPALGEGLVAAGSAAEQIRQQTPDRLLTPTQSALAAATGVATGAFGVLGGKAAAKLKIDDVDAILSGALPVNQKGNALVSVLKGALSEGVLEELPQSVSEQFFQNVALGRPRDEALAEAAVLGLLAGSITGGALQPYLINQARQTKVAQDLATQQQQVRDNLAQIRAEAEKLAQRSGAVPPPLPSSPASSSPTQAPRGPAGAPAPAADAPSVGESPLPPSAPADLGASAASPQPPVAGPETKALAATPKVGDTVDTGRGLGTVQELYVDDRGEPRALVRETGMNAVSNYPQASLRIAESPKPPESKASVPVMITRQMEADLRKLGYPQSAIDAMRPQEAGDILAQQRAFQPPTPAPNAPATVVQQPGVRVQPAQAPEGGVSPEAGAGDSSVRAKAKRGKAKEEVAAAPDQSGVVAEMIKAAADQEDASGRSYRVAAPGYSQEWALPNGVTNQMLDRASLSLSPAQLEQVFAELVRLNPSLSGIVLPSQGADYAGWLWAKPSRKIAGAEPRVRAILDVVRGVASKFQLDNIKFFVEDLKGSGQTRPDIFDTPAQKAAMAAAQKAGAPEFFVRPPAQPAPAPPVEQPATPKPVSPAEEFEATLTVLEQTGDAQAVATFRKLQDDLRKVPGSPSIEGLAAIAKIYASGALDKQVTQIALLMGLDSVPKIQVLDSEHEDLSAWAGTKKTGGFLVQGDQIYLDPFGFYSDLASNPVLFYKTVAHELWHVILDRATLQMSEGDRTKQRQLYRSLFEAVPKEFRDAAAKTVWASSPITIVDEFLRAVLEKNASPLLKRFSDQIDPTILATLSLAKTTEELSLAGDPKLLESLTKSVFDFDLSRSKVLGKQKAGLFTKIGDLFTNLLNTLRGVRAAENPADPLVQVIDAALQAAGVQAPKTKTVRVPGKGKIKVAAAPSPKRGGGRYAKDADVAAIKADVSQQKLIRFASEMTRLEQLFLERNPKLFEKFQQALSQDVLRDLPEQGQAADDFYSALARETEKMLASVTADTQELPPKFVPRLKQIRETKARIPSVTTSLEAIQEEGGTVPQSEDVAEVRVGANESFSWMMFRLAQLAAAERMVGGPKAALAQAVLNSIRSVREGGISDAKAFSPEFKIMLGMRQMTLLQAAEELGLPPLPVPSAGAVTTPRSLDAWNQQVRQAFDARPQARVIDEWLRFRRRELSVEGLSDADREALFARLSAVSKALDRRDQELLTLLENDALEGVRLDTRYSLPAVGAVNVDITQTPEFKAWFKDSKVVDKDGKPLVVYHGTTAPDSFTVFRTTQSGYNYGPGGYWTPEPLRASEYAKAEPSLVGYNERGRGIYEYLPERAKPGSRIYSAYVSLQNPYVVTSDASVMDLGSKLAQQKDPVATAMLRANPGTGTAEIGNAWLRQQGFDGVIKVRSAYHSEERGYVDEVTEVVAFYPEQIKSATGNRGTFDPTNPDIRYSLPAVGAVQSLDTAEGQLRGAATQQALNTLTETLARGLDVVDRRLSDTDQERLQQTRLSAYRQSLRDAMAIINSRLSDQGAEEPISLADDAAFEAAIEDPEIRASLDRANQPANDALRQMRQEVLAEQQAQQQVRDTLRLAELEAVYEVLKVNPAHAKLAKRVARKISTLKASVATLTPRASELLAYRSAEVDRAAAARANLAAPLRWLRTLGRFATSDSPVNALPISARSPEEINRALDAWDQEGTGFGEPSLDPGMIQEGLSPQEQQFVLRARASQWGSEADALRLQAQRFFFSFDNLRRQAFRTLQEKGAELHKDIARISRDLIQAKAEMSQKQLDLREALQLAQRGLADIPADQRDFLLQHEAVISTIAERFGKLLNDPDAGARAAQVLGFFANPPAGDATQVKAVADELGIGGVVFDRLTQILYSSAAVRGVLLDYLNQVQVEGLLPRLQRLQAAANNPALDNPEAFDPASPNYREARAAYQDAVAVRDGVMADVVGGLRSGIATGASTVSKLINQLRSRSVDLRALEQTSEVFETVAADPQFQAARSELDQGVFSLPQLIAPNADGKLEFRAFGMKNPQTGEPGLIYHAGFAVDPSDYNRTKVADQVRDYVAKLFEYRNAFAHARLNYTANAGPPPSQLGFDAPTLTAVETTLNKDAALYSALYLTSPEMVSGAEGAAARFIPGWNYLQRLQFPGIGLLSKVEPGVVAAKASGFFGSLLRPATGSLTRALQDIEGELTSGYDPADPDKGMSHLRRKAVMSHTNNSAEVGLLPIQDFDTYRKEVFNFVAALGLSRNPKLLKAGTYNPTSGRVITQEDIDFLKAQSDFNTKVYAKMQRRADRAIVEKHGDAFFSRFAQSPARFKANRFGSERMGKFVESVAAVDSEKTLLSGSPEAFAFWNSPAALGRAVAHVAGAAFDSANDAVTYRANMREAEEQLATRAMQGLETFRDVASIDELAAKIAAMPAARGLLPAQVREGLYHELDQLSRNARQMAQELRVEGENLLNDVNLDWVKLRRLSADNQFANPWGPRKLSFDLYDYGLLTDGDAHRFTRNAIYREMVDYGIALDNALKEVRMLIQSQKEARRTGTTSAAFEEAFTSEAEAATYEMQLGQLQASYADFVSGYRPRRWFDVLARIFDFQTQAVLASPTVTIKNLLFGTAMAHVAYNRRDLGQMRYGASGTSTKFFFRSMGEFGQNIISKAILQAAKRARVSNPNVPLGKVERWAARVQGHRMLLRGLGGSSRTSLLTDIRRGYEALQIKDTPEGRTFVLPERYADLEVWLGMAPVAAKAALKKVGTMAADAPLNMAAMVSMDALEQDFMVVADRYYDRLVKEGLLDPNNLRASVDRFLTTRDPKMAVKASDFSDQFTLVNNEARLQDLRRNFEFVGRPIDDMFLDWIVRRATNADAQLFVPEDRRAYLQALIQDVNAPNFANRPLSFATNQELAYTYRLMGYGINAGWALADFPTRVRRTQQMRKQGLGKGKYEGPWVVDASSIGWATSTALAFMIVGALGTGAAELYRRLMQRTEKSRDTVFDPDLWTSGDLKRWTRTLVRDGISVIPVPLVPETLHLFLNVDPFGKGFDGVAASFFGSALQAVISEAVTAGTTIRALAKGEAVEDAVARTERQAINAASRWVPGAKELFALLGAAGVDFFEGRQKALQERSAERFALSLNPDLARRGGAASSARAALTMSPSREPVRMLVEAAKTGNTEQYQQAMRMLQVDWQSRNRENAEAGRKLIEWDDYLRSVTESSIPFRTSAQRRPTEAETSNMLAAMSPDQRQRVAEQVAAVEAIRGTPVTISSRETSGGGGGGGGASLPSSSLRLPGIGRVSVGGGGGGGTLRPSRSRRRPRLTLGGRGRNLFRLRVRRLRSPRNRLLRRRRA